MAKAQPQVRRNRHHAMDKRKLALLGIPVLALALLVIWLLAYFLQPAAQKRIVMTAGASTGVYKAFADKYADMLKKEGVILEVRTSSGAVENYQRLKDNTSEYDIGFVQSGIGNHKDALRLQTLASVYYEPIWVFYRSPETIERLSQLKGKRISVGVQGSGLRKITTDLLEAYEVNGSNTSFKELNSQNAADSLKSGDIDAAFFIGGPATPVIQSLLKSDFKLMNFAQADAVVRKFPSLSKLTFPRGAISLVQDLPPHDVLLVSATALLVAKEKLHPAIAYLLLDIANEVHSEPSFFAARGDFPNQKVEDFPVSDEGRRYFKSGRPFLQRYLPFWLADFIENRFVILLPLLAVLFTLLQTLPRLYGFGMRTKLASWYGEIKLLEDEVWATENPNPSQIAQWHTEIEEIAANVNRLDIPQRYGGEIYTLKQAVNVVRERILVVESSANALLKLRPEHAKSWPVS